MRSLKRYANTPAARLLGAVLLFLFVRAGHNPAVVGFAAIIVFSGFRAVALDVWAALMALYAVAFSPEGRGAATHRLIYGDAQAD